MEKKNFPAFELVQALLCAVLLFSLFSWARPCGPKADGSWMTCHWAGQAVRGTAALLLILSLIRLFAKQKGIRAGLDLAAIPTALLTTLVPGRLIPLCMMAEMQCRSLMRPAVLVFSVLVILLCAVDLVRNLRAK